LDIDIYLIFIFLFEFSFCFTRHFIALIKSFVFSYLNNRFSSVDIAALTKAKKTFLDGELLKDYFLSAAEILKIKMI